MRLRAVLLISMLLVGGLAIAQQKAPNFRAKTQDGTIVELEKLRGKVVVVNYWATWCPPCRQEIPGFIEIYNKYKAKGLEIVGVSLDDQGWSAVKPFVEKSKIPYLMVLPDEHLANDYGKIESIPATFIIDRKGIIVKQHVGRLD